jgi:drug/metabolite transporter (DMT)-like permease
MTIKPLYADFLLVLVALSWGLTFLLVQKAVADVPVYTFLFWRFGLAFVLMLLPLLRTPHLDPDTVRAGVLLGVFNFGAYASQTYGLTLTLSSSVAFITGLFVVFVPLLSRVLFGQHIRPIIWGASLLSAAGLWLLTMQGGLDLSAGEVYALVCAVLFALHLIFTGRFSRRYDVTALVGIQFGTMAAGSALLGLGVDGTLIPPQWTPAFGWGLGITVVFATVFAFWVQTSMQRFTSASRAAVIFTLEPLSAAVFGYAYGGEMLTPAQIVGGVLIVASTLWIEIKSGDTPTPQEPTER